MQCVLIAAGGTGGHIFPAIAVAEKLQEQGVRLHWVGSCRGLEERLVAPDFPITYLSMEALRGKRLRQRLLFPFRFLRALKQVWSVVSEIKPDVVLVMGSFVSVPVGVVSWLRRIPLVVHEQNAKPGMANRLLMHFASTVLQAFPDTFSQSIGAITVGNPLRSEFLVKLSTAATRTAIDSRLRILVLGGSQGAHAINSVMIEWVEQYGGDQIISLWHQVGSAHFDVVKKQYDLLNCGVKLEAFIDDMAVAYQWADIVICRAGAMTVSEISAMAKPAIFIPFPAAVDDHQYYNAHFLAADQAAIVLRQSVFTAEKLQEIINKFIQNPADLAMMSSRIREHARLSATDDVEQQLYLASGHKRKRLMNVE